MFINKVTLYTHMLDEMREFYINHLGFHLSAENKFSFEIEVGKSKLEIIQTDTREKPFYHFAFNIPTNLFKEAKEWAKSRVKLNKEDGDDEVFFEIVNAHSFYFMDPSGNIVELIARHSESDQSTAKTFSVDEVLNISEINITTDDVGSVGNQLNNIGIPVRDGDSINDKDLNFMGERSDGAFLLLVSRNRRWFFSKKYSEIHPLSIQIDNQKNVVVNEKGNINIETMNHSLETNNYNSLP